MKYHCSIETPEGKVIDTWGVYPISNATKIMDGLYDPVNKTLKLLFDSVKEDFHEVPIRKDNGKYDTQLRRIESYYRGSINDTDLPFFLENYVDNNFEFIPDDKKLIIE